TLEVPDTVRREVDVDIGTLRLKPLAVVLTPIVVESTLVALSPRLADFYRRKKGGACYYITQDEIWKRNPLLTTDLLRGFAGIQVTCGGTGCVATTLRSAGRRAFSGRPCPMRVILDGVPSSLSLDEI